MVTKFTLQKEKRGGILGIEKTYSQEKKET